MHITLSGNSVLVELTVVSQRERLHLSVGE
jgi:hypothetical protein